MSKANGEQIYQLTINIQQLAFKKIPNKQINSI